MWLKHPLARLGFAMTVACLMTCGAQAQAGAELLFAEVPDDISVKFVFKSSGNANMVGSPDIPVIVSVVLSNKSEEPHTVFVTRYNMLEDDKPLDFPLGCMARITDAKGTQLLQQKDHPDGYWTSFKTDAKDDAAFRKDSRNKFEVPPKERRAFSIPLATLLAGGGTDATWPVADGKFIPGAYRIKIKWGGKESAELSLTVMPK